MMNTDRSGIYEIVNSVNGKRYIGSAKKFRRRRYSHVALLKANRHHNPHLQASWNKHGEGAFSFRPLLVCSVANLFLYEQICLDGLQHHYNKRLDAKSNRGMIRTAEWRAAMSKANIGKKHSPESRAKMSLAQRGKKCKPRTPEHCKSLSIAAMGNKRSLGTKHSKETIRKFSEAARRREADKRRRKCQTIHERQGRLIGLE